MAKFRCNFSHVLILLPATVTVDVLEPADSYLTLAMSPNVDIRQEIDDFVSRVKESVQKNPPIVLGVSAFAAGVVSIAVGRKVYIRNFRRIQNGDWITPDVFAKKKWIKGVVTT